MILKNDLLLRTARGEKTERAPVWVMRQAGRILKEYREIRAHVKGFIELVKTPELAAEVTVQPVDLLDVDAAIIFSDILVIPEAMGLPYLMEEKSGPRFPDTIRAIKDLDKIAVANELDLNYVIDAIRITKQKLDNRVPLIGFTGAPWTLFCYMTEGKGSKTFSVPRKLLYTDPEFSHKLLDMITKSTIVYLKAQIRAGADLVQIFDSWAGILPAPLYEDFSLKYIERICQSIHEVPVIVFAKGAYASRPALGKLSCEVVGLDWNMNIEESRQIIGPEKVLQGNLDPAVLYGSYKEIEKQTLKMLQSFGRTKYIANLGHGVYPDTDPEKVRFFINTVKKFEIS
jgi:uroporphyrinogen decarboxylase